MKYLIFNYNLYYIYNILHVQNIYRIKLYIFINTPSVYKGSSQNLFIHIQSTQQHARFNSHTISEYI